MPRDHDLFPCTHSEWCVDPLFYEEAPHKPQGASSKSSARGVTCLIFIHAFIDKSGGTLSMEDMTPCRGRRALQWHEHVRKLRELLTVSLLSDLFRDAYFHLRVGAGPILPVHQPR